ncbi:LysR family transcriptional regulator ArgP [Kribbella sandramycini]|uniref:LysR family transcriptional regulator (Chromosome initiation inhibitor) n=1 Tax=Kribbella sandramycini TaxID=60450 RepID=A0A7Y4L194_9ACTN|nr:LysR family transcriptional regulator ArgP [Kribbella sandramycini]MBB6565398.1 LysR family transcriptional regulator (chromosome initiation inhibitor) [Kribbella sandramycini]NOL41667.1 LysR family transcriptional regulator ArgP [Kribbella sandramycini]
MQIDSAQLETFAAVVDEGSFDAAAQRLRVTPSAVSQRIKALESRLGQVVVMRGRPARPTAAGEAVLRLARQVALLELEAIAAVRGTVDAMRLPVAVNADSLNNWFLPAMLELTEQFPARFVLHSEDQDHSAEYLRNGTVLAAVTADPKPVQGCRVVPLGKMRYLSVANPRYAERWLADRPLADALAEAPVVVFNDKDLLQHRLIRKVTRRRVDPPVHTVPAAGAFQQAVLTGLGWGTIEEQFARPAIAAGRLVEVAQGKHIDVPLYWQHWKLESAVLTALTAAVLRAATASLRT